MVQLMVKAIYTACLICISTVFACAQKHDLAARIDSYLTSRIQQTNITGMAVAVVKGDSVLLTHGYGYCSDKRSVDADTRFSIASLSKGFTATAVLQLAEQNKIDLDSPVIAYLPQLRQMQDKRIAQLNVRQLLNQISGMSDKGYAEFMLKQPPANLEEAIKLISTCKLTSAPGSNFAYHNPNYQILARLVEVVSGEAFNSYLQHHIFMKLQMFNTYDAILTSQQLSARDATVPGHIYVLGRPVVMREPEWFVDGAAGIVSTANDMAKWMSDQLKISQSSSSAVLTKGSLKEMQTPPQKNKADYAMGWHANGAMLYHSGIYWTYSSQVLLHTDKGYGVALLINDGNNLTIDYQSILSDIDMIIIGAEPTNAGINPIFYTGLAVFVLLSIAIIGTRRMLRLKKWYNNYNERRKWQTWLRIFLRLAPLMLFLCMPTLVTLLSGRVLGFERIALMFADVVLLVGIIALFNLLIVAHRIIYLLLYR